MGRYHHGTTSQKQNSLFVASGKINLCCFNKHELKQGPDLLFLRVGLKLLIRLHHIAHHPCKNADFEFAYLNTLY